MPGSNFWLCMECLFDIVLLVAKCVVKRKKDNNRTLEYITFCYLG